MRKRLLGIGECMVELFPESPGLWRQGFAGDVFNTLWYARACASTADSVEFHTGLGKDAISAEFENFLVGHGIELGNSPRFDERTLGLYSIQLNNGERSFSYWRDASAARWLAADRETLARRVGEANIVYLSGITLAILSPDHLDVLHQVLSEARNACEELVIAFDPNIRPKLWSSAEHMRASIERIAAIAHVVLPGVEDEALCFGNGTATEVAKRYLELGSNLVVVKEGGQRVLVRGEEDLDFTFESIEQPVDTTGAGDAFAGAFLAGLLNDAGIEASIRRAHDCASSVIMTQGALCAHEKLPASAKC